MKPIYLDPNQVPQYLRGSYTGKTFKAIVTDSISVPQDAGLWQDGSRETYRFVELATGRSVPSPCQQTAPWDQQRQEFNSPLPAGIAMVEHSIFCGKDMGLTFASSTWATRWKSFPASKEGKTLRAARKGRSFRF